MKKFLGLLTIAVAMVACDNAATAEDRIKDSLDSVENLQKESVQEAADDAQQNIEQKFDSLEQKVDSVGAELKDSL